MALYKYSVIIIIIIIIIINIINVTWHVTWYRYGVHPAPHQPILLIRTRWSLRRSCVPHNYDMSTFTSTPSSTSESVTVTSSVSITLASTRSAGRPSRVPPSTARLSASPSRRLPVQRSLEARSTFSRRPSTTPHRAGTTHSRPYSVREQLLHRPMHFIGPQASGQLLFQV